MKIQTTPLKPASLRLMAVFGLIVIVAADTSRLLSFENLQMSMIWPVTGLMLGATIVRGFPVAIVSGVAIVVWLTCIEGAGLIAALILALAQVAGILPALYYLRARGGAQTELQSSTRERLVYVKAGLIASTVTAAFGTGAIAFSLPGGLSYETHDIFLVYWLLELLSVLLFAPLAYYFLLNTSRFADALRRDLLSPKGGGGWVAIVVLGALVWVLPEFADRTYAVALSFAFFPVLCWFVLSVSPASTLLMVPCFAVGYAAFSVWGLGGVPELQTVNQVVRSLLLLGGVVLFIQVIGVMNFSRNQLLETFRQQANTDFLSGLANDRAFAAEVGRRLPQRGAREEGQTGAGWLVYLQVLDFDHVEDLMGYRASRNMETMLAARLMGTCGPETCPARIGNGIFSLIVSEQSETTLIPILQRVYDAFDDQVFGTGGQQSRIRVAIGAVELNGELDDQSQYLSAATQASLMARDRLPRIQVVQDVAGMITNRKGMTQRLELLKDALSNDRFSLFAQPIRRIGHEEQALTYEILVRLQDPNGDFLSPGLFLPLAEAYGFMRQIDHWVIDQTFDALAQNPDWLARTRKCSINLAGVSLSSDDILKFIIDAFQRTGIPPEKIGFEVTETQNIQSRETAEKVTEGLRRLGCSVSLDDFGTGLATFDYLKSFRFDTLKIDGVFIKSIMACEEDRRIVRAVCDVARGMGLNTVAEFVETDEVVSLLRELGVDYGQGFGLGRPAPLEQMFQC